MPAAPASAPHSRAQEALRAYRDLRWAAEAAARTYRVQRFDWRMSQTMAALRGALARLEALDPAPPDEERCKPPGAGDTA